VLRAAFLLLLLAAVAGCESQTNPERAEWLEIFNDAFTVDGEPNTHHITSVQIRRTDVGGLLPHDVDIAPGQSHVFSVLWPGEHEITVRYDDGNAPRRQDPEDPFWIHNASTREVRVWY
jgi:hypothetical protein